MPTNEPTPGRSRPGRPRGFKKGAVKYTKMYLQRVQDTRALRASVNVLETTVGDRLHTRLAPELAAGEAMPDFGLSTELLVRSVESALGRLRAAEHRCFDRQSKVTITRGKSERLARHEIYPQVVLVRRMIDAQVGRENGRAVHGLSGSTLRKARRLHGQLQVLMSALGTERHGLPEPLSDGIEAERETWLRKIEPGYRQLSELLAELADLEVLELLARDDRSEAIRKFDATYGEASRWVEASFAFAGVGGRLSRMLRSYSHRRLLARDAHRKREARAEGRVKQTLRSAAASVAGWIGTRPRTVA